jgi:hypothetical protein
MGSLVTSTIKYFSSTYSYNFLPVLSGRQRPSLEFLGGWMIGANHKKKTSEVTVINANRLLFLFFNVFGVTSEVVIHHFFPYLLNPNRWLGKGAR